LSEERLLAWLRELADPRHRWIGDDAALLAATGPLAVTVDHQVSGVHFVPDLDPAVAGARLVAVNLSDLAAVGARPVYAFLALAAPPEQDLKPFCRGVVRACRRAGLQLAGGDLSRGDRLSASLTVIGRRVARGRWLRRAGARPGDELWLGGTIGESALGRALLEAGARPRGGSLAAPRELAAELRRTRLGAAARRAVRRHLEPRPQLELGAWLARGARTAAIDLSDGFALDLDRLRRASGVGVEVETDRLPLAAGHRRLAALLGRDPWELALAGGEDYVLLFTRPPAARRPPAALGALAVGRIVETPGMRLRAGGVLQPLAPAGWDHFSAPRPRRRT
jgi:thiamine-monophosphate kinase